MDFDIPSPSQFPSPSQWVNACTRPAFTDMNADVDGDVVRWIGSQWQDPAIQQLMAVSKTEEELERRPSSSASAYTPTWIQSASTSANSTTRTASLPTFSPASSSTLPTTSTFASARKLHQRKPLSRKTPPSRAHLSAARTKDDRHVNSDRSEERLLDLMGSASRKADQNSWLKQVKNEKEAKKKKLTSGTSGDTVAWMNTVSASSSGSRLTSAASNPGPLQKTPHSSTVPRASARSLGSSMSETLSSTILKPTIKLSRDSGTGADVEMITDSDRDTDLEGSAFTDSPGSFTVADALNKSFSMNVDDILPPSTKRTLGRVPSAAIATASPTATSSEKISQMTHARPPVLPSTTQRHPPPLGMRRLPNLPNTGFPSSQSRYATTQSSYAVSQAKGQKQATPRPFKPPLLSKPNPKPVHTSKQNVQKPESPPTSTPELEMDDGDCGVGVADSSFDVSFEVDRDALEATMRQYD